MFPTNYSLELGKCRKGGDQKEGDMVIQAVLLYSARNFYKGGRSALLRFKKKSHERHQRVEQPSEKL